MLLVVWLWCGSFAYGQENGRRPLRVSYGSVSVTRAPLWIARDAGLFRKYGLDVELVYIPAGSISVSALVAGNVDIIATAASSVVTAAAHGLPVVIIASDGPARYKLVAHPSITSVEQLKGKTIGVSRLGTGPDVLLRRALARWNLVAGQDVTVIPTGLTDSLQRMLIMLNRRLDATVASANAVFEMELQGKPVSVLADFLSLGLFTSASEISTTREFLTNRRGWVKAFLAAYGEGIALAKRNKEVSYQALRKYLKVEDPRMLDFLQRSALGATRPDIPCPLQDSIQLDIEFLRLSVSELKGKNAADFVDASVLAELEHEGFFAKLKR